MPYFTYQDKKVFYIDEGKGDAILLLPGNTATSAVHKSEIEFFSKSFRIICPDYIGYGQSDRVEHLSVDSWWTNAEMCVQLLDFLEINRYNVIGTSGGGITALNVAIIAQNKVNCIIADSIPGEFPNKEQLIKEIEERKKATEELKAFWHFANGPDWEQVIKVDSLMILQTAELNESIFKDRLNEIKCPVLLTGSLMDDGIPNIETGVCNIARKVKLSKVVFYPEGGHPLMWSKPEEFRREAVQFISNIKTQLGSM